MIANLPSSPLGSNCAFCNEAKPLVESHVLPAFVFRWLKETSATGFMRFAENPAKRVQDGIKLPWLCEGCEALFNSFETPFASNLFHPYNREEVIYVRYRDWLARFCASISWRVLKYCYQTKGLDHFSEVQRAEAFRALEVWRAFISGDIQHPGKYEQHLLPLGPVESSTVPGMSNHINRYFMRGTEFDLPCGEAQAFTFAKLGRFAIFGVIQPGAVRWRGSRISPTSGVIQPTKYQLPMGLLDYLNFRAAKHREYADAIPDHHREKIEASILKNPERLLQSDELKAMLRDGDMFGEEAIIRKPKS